VLRQLADVEVERYLAYAGSLTLGRRSMLKIFAVATVSVLMGVAISLAAMRASAQTGAPQ
jgi:hypothetical protein